MTIPIRLLGGLPGAFIITALIFLILAVLIGLDKDVRIAEETPLPDINILPKLEDRTLAPPAEFVRPVLDHTPPPPPALFDQAFRPDQRGAIIDLPDLSIDMDIVTAGTNLNAHPVVRPPPQYPSQCSQSARPVETVIVQFNVTSEGTVVSPEVLNTTNRCFNRAATRAIERWRYAPRIVENVAQPMFGVQAAIDFTLEGQ